jgi:hypothetical protein
VYTSGAPGQNRRVDDPEQPSEPVAKLLARWGIPAGAAVALAERGTNNRTLQVTADRRWCLRISQNLTRAQVHAEHRLLARLARAGLPFAVPAPVPLPDGRTVADTPDRRAVMGGGYRAEVCSGGAPVSEWHPALGAPERLLRAVALALSGAAGGPVAIRSATTVTEGWSGRFGASPWIVRCAVSGPAGWGVTSVVVKTRRPGGHVRGGDTTGRERAALTFLAEIGSDAGPRVIAHDPASGFVVLEDVGRGIALEDVLVGGDPAAATSGFIALAKAVGRMQAATLGRQDSFYARLGGSNAQQDRVSLAGMPLAECWSALRDPALRNSALRDPALRNSAGHYEVWPDPAAAEPDIGDVLAWMSEAEPMLVLSNGDLAPQNCRLSGRSARLLDFEAAKFQHALLDAAHLRLPFYGGPCWSRIPAGVGALVESAYREELGRSCPGVLDAQAYAAGMAAATAAWAVVRLVRLPKLLARDEPHPMGFSRRGQLLDTIQVAVDAASTAGTLPSLRAWFERASTALRGQWPHLPAAQEVYPAYRQAR